MAKKINDMESSSPSPPLVSPPGTQAGGCDDDIVSALPNMRNKDDDELSKPPFLENIGDTDDADVDDASSAVSTSTTAEAEAEAEAEAAAAAAANEPPPPPISRLPEEMLSCIFAFLPPAAVGRASCVCSGWRDAAVGWDAVIWREALARALGSLAAAEAARIALAAADASAAPSSSLPTAAAGQQEAAPPLPLLPQPTWRRTFLATPAPRCDGFYVSRETYIRAGITEWTVRNPVHVVVYFRYYRFFPPQAEEEEGEAKQGEGAAAAAMTDASASAPAAASAAAPPSDPSSSLKPPRGRFWYRTTPDPPAKAARSLALGPPRSAGASSSPSPSSSSEKSSVVEGRYRLGGGGGGGPSPPGGRRKRVDPAMLRTAWRVRNSAGTEVRAKLKLRSSKDKEGAWDRMDVLGLASHDLASGLTLPFMAQNNQAEEEDDGGFPSATVRRGGGRQQQQQHQAPRAPPPLAHKRGLSTFVFIPWNAVEDSPLNLPLSQMDCWIPG